MPDRQLAAAAERIKQWRFTPTGTEGYAKAEVTAGGIDTAGLSSRTMEARTVKGLYFIGEAVDVTGWLGGYNFQWAWSSGWSAGDAISQATLCSRNQAYRRHVIPSLPLPESLSIMSFASLPVAIAQALADRGYAEPTPVQAEVLKAEADDRDLLVSAQTGSGKTVAYGLALARTLLGEAERLPPTREPLALIIAPTRELALQVQRELDWLYAKAGARVVSCVGGMDMRREQRTLGQGAHIVVGTPGRLRDHLERGSLVPTPLRAVVLDEADAMLALGFRDDVDEILDATPAEGRQIGRASVREREGQYGKIQVVA